MTTLPTPSRNVRAILVQQHDRAPHVDLPLPVMLRHPFLLLMWTLVLSTVVAALLLGRIHVPRTAHGLVIAPVPASADSLTPILLLPAWSRQFIQPGKLASVDTGGSERLTVTIATVDSKPLTLTAAGRWLSAPNASAIAIDTTMVVARLTPCTSQECPKLASGTRYTAVAQLGTRSLASYAIPGT